MCHKAGLLWNEGFDVRNQKKITLSLVVPVYNESETVGLFLERVRQLFYEVDDIDLDIVFVKRISLCN